MVFTGLIQETGKVRKAGRRGGFLTLEIAYDGKRGMLRTGDSMAVSGVCLTATTSGENAFTADLSEETQRSSTLGGLKVGDRVNLERPVAAADPLGGHIVLGHVDGVGRLRRVTPAGGGLRILIEAPQEIMGLLVEKGSAAVDGVSLTVGSLQSDAFEVFLIPETQARTTLSDMRVGERVNLEADYLAKLVWKFLGRDRSVKELFPGVRGED